MKILLFRGSAALLLALGACNQGAAPIANNAEDQAAAPELPTAPPAANESQPATPPEPGTPGGLADDKTPLAEPTGRVDPRSAEAAGQVVQQYGALIEQGRWTQAWTLWSDAAAAKQFDRNWRNDSEVHLQIGKPGDMEGAAGSSYVTVPVVFYGKAKGGAAFNRKADVILRRVNDVPGSTEAQRHWHIARIAFR
jgi:hypothetical protein